MMISLSKFSVQNWLQKTKAFGMKRKHIEEDVLSSTNEHTRYNGLNSNDSSSPPQKRRRIAEGSTNYITPAAAATIILNNPHSSSSFSASSSSFMNQSSLQYQHHPQLEHPQLQYPACYPSTTTPFTIPQNSYHDCNIEKLSLLPPYSTSASIGYGYHLRRKIIDIGVRKSNSNAMNED
jgi:hypothetical protein